MNWKKVLLSSLALPVDKKRHFLNECKVNLVALIKKLQEKHPLNYFICRNSSSLSPLLIVNSKMRCIAKFSCLVGKLYEPKLFCSKDSDCAKKQYDTLIKSANSEWKDKFLQFEISDDSIDSFFTEFMQDNLKFKCCWEVFKLIFILSHGQASVERDFSVNKELLTENLEEVSMDSQ